MGAASPGISRRRLLQGVAATGVLAPRPGRADDTLDVAVIGGGVAGCYVAARLLDARPALRVALFEASGRVGGRLHSYRFAEAPHVVAEVGGMRFLSDHRLVRRAASHLGLAEKVFVNHGAANFLNLRGRSIRFDAVGRGDNLFPYDIPPADQVDGWEALLHRGADAIVPGASGLSSRDWSAVRSTLRLSGRPLRDWPLRNALEQVLSFEECRFLAAASGYDQMVDGPNAVDMLQLMLAHDTPGQTVHTLSDGYQALPLALAAAFRQAGGAVHLGRRLLSLVPEKTGSATAFRLEFGSARGRAAVGARRVILAMGRSAIESIPGVSPFRSEPRAAALVASVAPWPMAKAFLVYPEPWWQRLGIAAGNSITDMPARQFWYFGTGSGEPGGMAGNRGSLLMSYCDADSVSYWQGLSQAKLDAGFAVIGAESLLARELHRQAMLVHGVDDAPRPIAACFQDWTVEPYGGAVHHWQVGVDSDAAMAGMLRPIPELDIFVCGEAWSRRQGWVEGALETSEALLTEHLGIAATAWALP